MRKGGVELPNPHRLCGRILGWKLINQQITTGYNHLEKYKQCTLIHQWAGIKDLL